jgi:hypothetical protein
MNICIVLETLGRDNIQLANIVAIATGKGPLKLIMSLIKIETNWPK